MESEVEQAGLARQQQLHAAAAIVEAHTEEMRHCIARENIDRAIEAALANPIDFEYAIDKDGHIFRGRSTKSSKINSNGYEQLPLASEQ